MAGVVAPAEIKTHLVKVLGVDPDDAEDAMAWAESMDPRDCYATREALLRFVRPLSEAIIAHEDREGIRLPTGARRVPRRRRGVEAD